MTVAGSAGEVVRFLETGVRPLVDEKFRSGVAPILDAERWVRPAEPELGRAIRLEPVRRVVTAAMERHPQRQRLGESWDLDAWLAPRLHAALRLSRREAADGRLWAWLAVVAVPDFVRWRFAAGERRVVPVSRFLGRAERHALAGLWWGAELTRDGPDYSATLLALRSSSFIDRWLALDAVHRRAAAVAVARFLEEFNPPSGATNEQSTTLARALNVRLATVSLDGLCGPEPADPVAVAAWLVEPVDADALIDGVPRGPAEPTVPATAVERVHALLEEIARDIDLGSATRARRDTA